MRRPKGTRNPRFEKCRGIFFKSFEGITFEATKFGFKIRGEEFLFKCGTKYKREKYKGWQFKNLKKLPLRPRIVLFGQPHDDLEPHFFLVPYKKLRARAIPDKVFVNAEEDRQKTEHGRFIWKNRRTKKELSNIFQEID